MGLFRHLQRPTFVNSEAEENANYFPNDFDQLYTICDVRRAFILRDMQREFHERFHNKPVCHAAAMGAL